MKLENGASVTASVTATGRKTGLPRTVELRFLYYDGCYYATSSRVKGKHWCQNMIANPAVDLNVRGERLACVTRQVTDDDSRRRILTLRDSTPDLTRVVFEIKPNQ